MTVTYITVFFVHFISADLVKGESVFVGKCDSVFP